MPSRRVRTAFVASLVIGAITFLAWWISAPSSTTNPSSENEAGARSNTQLGPPRGGTLNGVARSAPIGFNPYVIDGAMRDAVALLTQAPLVRVDSSGEPQPWLAESWTESPDRLTITFKLRPGLLWSDGIAVTAGDVVFSVRAAADGQSSAKLREQLSIGGKPLAAREIDPLTVAITFPSPFAPGVLLLERLPILPRHRLETAFAAGTFARAWPFTVAEADVVGLGPFVLSSNAPDKMTFSRNTRYWRKGLDEAPLPYVEKVEIAIAGAASDWSSVVSKYDFAVDESIHAGVPAAVRGGTRAEQGLGFDALWFNLRSPRTSQQWMADDRFRAAVAAAVDRRAYCTLAACDPVGGPVSPANRRWFNPDLPLPRPDLAKARAMLAEMGMRDTNNDGVLEDGSRRPLSFELMARDYGRADPVELNLIQRTMKDIGIAMDFKTMREPALSESIEQGRYEAMLATVTVRDPDPALNLDLWLSSGSRHSWHPRQEKPATAWERQIDELMMKQASSGDRAERVQLFADAQKIFVQHMPMIPLGARDVSLATSARVLNVAPSILRPHILWNVDEVAVR